eukprot:230333-Pyramimonas_sp.AAC.1
MSIGGDSVRPAELHTDSDVDGPGSAAACPPPVTERIACGTLVCYLIVATPGGMWSRLFRKDEIDAMGAPITKPHVVGAVLGQWMHVPEFPRDLSTE